jgi:hypothetical protein
MEKRNWTLEQLVAWVETVEPKEVQPEDGPSLVIQRRESRSFELQRLRRRKSGTPSATPSRLGMPHRETGVELKRGLSGLTKEAERGYFPHFSWSRTKSQQLVFSLTP